MVYIDPDADDHRLQQVDFRLDFREDSADFPAADEKIVRPLDVDIQLGIAFNRVMHGHGSRQREKRGEAGRYLGTEYHRKIQTAFPFRMPRPPEPTPSCRLRFC